MPEGHASPSINEPPTGDGLQVRVHGDAALPTLVYLPGLHGDWTLIGRFRQALNGRVRFVEVTYPRTLTWTLEDYAAEIESALAAKGVATGWWLAESFGSQVLWPLLIRKRFISQGALIAGGFVRHPTIWTVRLAEKLTGEAPFKVIVSMLFGYARIARMRHGNDPQVRASLDAFLARRTPLDIRAAQHRLHLIANNDFRPAARRADVPIHVLTGFWDPIVPWPPVRRWLRKNCRTLTEYTVIPQSDHNVLNNAAQAAAQWALERMGVAPVESR